MRGASARWGVRLIERCFRAAVARTLTLALVASLAVAAPAAAQGLEFVVARFATQSSHALYAGYGVGPGIAFVGVLQNPRSAYREALVGVGKAFRHRRTRLLAGLAIATTSNGDLVQLYLLSTSAVGPVKLDADVSLQRSLEATETQFYVAPVNAFIPITRSLALGATWTVDATLGGGVSHAGGPAASVAVPGGTVGVHWMRGFGERPDELWVRVSVTP